MADFFLAEFLDTPDLTAYVCDIGGPFTAPNIDPGDSGSTPAGLAATDLDGESMRFDDDANDVHALGITTAPPQKDHYFETKVRADPTLRRIRMWVILRAAPMDEGISWPHAITGFGAIFELDGAGNLNIYRVGITNDTIIGSVDIALLRVIPGFLAGVQTFKFRVEASGLKRRIYFNDGVVGEDYIGDPLFDIIGDIYFYKEGTAGFTPPGPSPLDVAFDYMRAGTDMLNGERTGIFWKDFVLTQEVDT